MGNIHRIKRSMGHHAPKIAMADAHMSVNGCRVFVGHPDENTALATAAGFKKMLEVAITRSGRVNMSDMYSAMFGIRDKILSGELWN